MAEADFLVPVASSLRLAEAEAILDAALRAAPAAQLVPLAVAVLDAGAQAVAFRPQDGCGVVRFEIARGGTQGALGMGSGSREIRDRKKERRAFRPAIAAATNTGPGAAVAAVMADATFRSELEAGGLEAAEALSPTESLEFMASEVAKWRPVVAATGAKLE